MIILICAKQALTPYTVQPENMLGGWGPKGGLLAMRDDKGTMEMGVAKRIGDQKKQEVGD